MPIKICSFCGRLIQEGETHRLEEFLDTIDAPAIRLSVDQWVEDLAKQKKSDPDCICSNCFARFKNS